MRATGRGTRLLAATAICTVYSAPAFASDYGKVSTTPDPVAVETGENVVGDKSGVLSTGTELSLTNEGTIRGNGLASFTSNTDAGVAFNGGPAYITNSGSISGARFGISSFYYSTDFTDPDNPVWDGRAIGSSITNSGSIIGDTDDGIRLIGGGTVTNSGYIAGRVGAGADGISMFSYEGQPLDSFVSIGSVSNLAGGTIEGNRFGIILSNGGSVDNAGIISGNSGAILIQAQTFDTGRTGTLTNSGTLNGAVAFANLASASVTNSGSITGALSGIRNDSTLLTVNNSGTIRGNGLSDSQSGSDGGIMLRGGPGNIVNSGSISGANFGITTSYGLDENDELVGLAIGSSITNSGSIIGDTDDGIRLIGGGTVTNSGYIAGRVGALADGISMFSYEGQPLGSFVSIGSVSNLAGGTIEGNRFGVILSNGGSVDNAGTISGNSGAILIQAQISDPGRTGTVTNVGTINGTVAFANLASASVANSGSITGALSGIRNDSALLTVNNSGTIRGNGLSDSQSGSDGGIMLRGGPGDIVNSGSISGANFGITTSYGLDENDVLVGLAIGSSIKNSGSIIGDTDDGIRLIGGGTVTNSGYIAGRVGAVADGISMFSYDDQPLGSFVSIGSVSNLAGGTIEGNRFGVILSNGGSVNNAGTIRGNSGAILIQAQITDPGRAGTVSNSGTINGAVAFANLASASVTNSGAITTNGSAISSDSNLVIANLAGGSITGLSGNGAYGTGIFQQNLSKPLTLTLNNAGTISAQGDGVYFANGTIQNSGSITGRVFGLFGQQGQITNSGTVSASQGSGIRMSGSSSITNTGQITGTQYGVYLGGGGTVTNSGTIAGSTSCCAAVQIANGGTLNNTGVIGGNKGSSAVAVGFSATSPGSTATLVNDGKINGRVVITNQATANIVINSTGRVDLGTSSLTIGDQTVPKAILSDSPTTLTVAGSIFNPIQLSEFADTVILRQKSSTTWIDTRGGQDVVQLTGTENSPKKSTGMPWLDGVESLQVTGGYWYMNFANTETFGSTVISNGTLQVDASFKPFSMTSPTTINSGGTLAGRLGAIQGNVTVNNGGMINPGGVYNGSLVPNSTLSVTGNVAFNAGSIFAVDTTPTANNSDRLNVTGAVTINNGAQLQILAGNGKYTTSSYTILTASGGINGGFGTVTTDMAFLTPQVVKNNNSSLVLTLTYNKKPLATAATANTLSVATAISSIDQGNPIHQSILVQSLDGASQAFESLSGASFGRLDAALADGVGRAEIEFGEADSDAPIIGWSESKSISARGLKSGFGSSHGPVSLGVMAGRYIAPIHTGGISGDADTYFFGGMLGYRAGRFQSLASASTASHDVSLTRAIAFPGFTDSAASRYRARTSRIDVEGSYAFVAGTFTLAPYGGYSHLILDSKAFTEQGGISALTIAANSRAIDQFRFGMRLGGQLQIAGAAVAPNLDASIERTWGALKSQRTARFGFGSDQFDSVGPSLNNRNAKIVAGIDVKAGLLTLTAGYQGQFGDQWSDQSARFSAVLRF